MKACKYCGSANADSAEKCKQCGAYEFSYKCNNCGTMFDRGFCPNCGVKAGAVGKMCPKCGEKYFTAACPSCGYTPAATETAKTQPEVVVVQAAPKKKGIFGKVLLWIFFLPVMAIIAIWKAKKLPKIWKIILTAVIAFITIIYYIGSSKTNESADAAASATATAAVEKESKPNTEKQKSAGKPAVEPSTAAYEITYQSAKTHTDSIGSVWVQTIVEIANTGSVPLYLRSGAYDLEDKNGKLVASRTMVSTFPDVIDVGEKGYMYEETILDDAPQGELTILPRPDVEAAKIDLIRFPVTDEELKDGDYGMGVKLMGRVENTSAETQSMVYIVCVLYGADGTPIGLMFNILMEDLEAGKKSGFECGGLSLPDDVTLDAVASHVTYAYPMQMQF